MKHLHGCCGAQKYPGTPKPEFRLQPETTRFDWSADLWHSGSASCFLSPHPFPQIIPFWELFRLASELFLRYLLKTRGRLIVQDGRRDFSTALMFDSVFKRPPPVFSGCYLLFSFPCRTAKEKRLAVRKISHGKEV